MFTVEMWTQQGYQGGWLGWPKHTSSFPLWSLDDLTPDVCEWLTDRVGFVGAYVYDDKTGKRVAHITGPLSGCRLVMES